MPIADLRRSRQRLGSLALVATAAFGGVATSGPAGASPVRAEASRATLPTLVVDSPAGTGAARPRTIFLSADAGPELVHLRWRGWGSARAVAHGTLREGQTNGGGSGPATLVLTGRHTCRSGRNRTYAEGLLTDAIRGTTHHLRFPAYAPIAYCRP